MPNQAVRGLAASATQLQSLKLPANGKINVAFIVSEGADLMDIAGPREAGNLRENIFLCGEGPAAHGYAEGWHGGGLSRRGVIAPEKRARA
ncbi:MAG: hypothetical protein ACRD3N_10920 [Terracidiphilus sp.]